MDEFMRRKPEDPEINKVRLVLKEELLTIKLLKESMQLRASKEEVMKNEGSDDLSSMIKSEFLYNEHAFKIEPVL
jgi:hypothetical protein